VANRTYLVDRGEYIALKHHRTDIVEFYPEHAVFTAGSWDTVTTKERICALTPFRAGSLHPSNKYRTYLTYGRNARLFLSGVPAFGLDYASGVHASYSGRWLPQSPEDHTTHVTLPTKGARKHCRQVVNSLRKQLRPHLTMLQGKQVERRYDRNKYTVAKYLREYEFMGDLCEDEIDCLVDTLLHLMQWNRLSVNEMLTKYITPDIILPEHTEERIVHHDDVPKLLDIRGPEWTD
jgi:hypothetical protein